MTNGNGTLPWLKTSGNKIVTADGQEVILRGANIMRAEWDNSLSWEKTVKPSVLIATILIVWLQAGRTLCILKGMAR